MRINKGVAIAVSVVCVVAVLVAATLSFYLFSTAKKEMSIVTDTNEVLQKQYDTLKKQLIGEVQIEDTTQATSKNENDSVANKEEATTVPPAGSVTSDFTALGGMLDTFIPTYYNADTQRTSVDLMKSINPYLTEAAQKKYAPTGTGEKVNSNYKYQSRITIAKNYFTQVSDTKAQGLSICTLNVTTSAGSSTSTILFKTENVLVNGTWKVDTFAIVVTDAFPAEKLA